MAHEPCPAFQFYPKDFLADGHVAAMSLEERGAYITLLCLCWREGSLPNDPKRLARMVGITQRAFLRVWPGVQACFTERDGRLTQRRLDKEREKQARYRQRQTDAAKARWQCHGNATAYATAMPEACSPISDLRTPVEEYQPANQQGPSPIDRVVASLKDKPGGRKFHGRFR